MPELLERLAAGDRAALARVTRIVTATLRRLGAYDLGDELGDLCQEIVWALVTAVRAGRAPAEKVGSFILAVTRNQHVSWLRRRGSRPTMVSSDGDGRDPWSAAGPAGADGEGLALEDRLAARQALAGLCESWQALLVARYVEGRSVEVLVEETGRSRATVNRELRRAREAFRAQLVLESVTGRANVGGKAT
jgi:RNA polymerase sigma factor (sigma-70 family)